MDALWIRIMEEHRASREGALNEHVIALWRHICGEYLKLNRSRS